MESLEERSLPTTLFVTTTADSGGGSLRQAIESANGGADPDTIEFNIPASDGNHVYYTDDGVSGSVTEANIATTTATDDSTIADIDPDHPHSWWRIQPLTALPTITKILTIDGYTQPGASPNTLTSGQNAILLVELDGRNVGTGGYGLRISGGGSTLRGLVINHSFLAGVFLESSGGNSIEGSFVGTGPSGTSSPAGTGNLIAGVSISDSPANLVGGPTPATRNLISGNGFGFAGGNPAIAISGVGAAGNVIQGNYIGTTANGTAALPNSGHGVVVFNAGNANVIGGPTATPGTGAGNVISGNGIDAIHFEGTGAGHTVQGNILGLNVTGTVPVQNGNLGVSVNNNPGGHIIGGLAPGAGNVISGNQNIGIIFGGAPGNVVQGNFIGTDITGTVDLGNAGGIFLNSSNNNMIGGPTAGAGNLISGNGSIFAGGQGIAGSPGIELNNFSAGNVIEGNRIGTQADGVGPLGNSQVGVLLSRASNTTVRGNTIAFSGNSEGSTVSGVSGLAIQEGTGNALVGNRFFGNSGLAIDLNRDGVTANDSGDADGGPNNTQNFPVLSGAASDGSTTSLTGTIDSIANTSFRIEFFATGSPDVSGFGEGRVFLGSTTVVTDATGKVGFAADLPAGVPVGQFVTATATLLIDDDANPNTPLVPRDTSEFAANRAVTLLPPSLRFSTDAIFVQESGGYLVTVNLGGDPAGTVTVNYATSDGSAVAGTDYTAVSGTLTFGPGETSKSFSISITEDTAIEADETIYVTLSDPTGGAELGSPSTAVVSIQNDDKPVVSFKLSSSASEEYGHAHQVTVELSRPSPFVTEVDVVLDGGTATSGADFTLPIAHLVFLPRETQGTLSVVIEEDGAVEGDETVRLALRSPRNATLGIRPVHTLSILDDDLPPDQAYDRVGDTDETARVVDLFSVPRQFASDPLQAGDTDVYAVELRTGDFLAIDVDPFPVATFGTPMFYPVIANTTLVVADANHVPLATVGRSREPHTGVFSDNAAHGFAATYTGTYYLRFTTTATTPKGYIAEFHRNGLAEGAQEIETLRANTGPLYAGLVGNRLLIRGPSGYGFAIRGNWKQTISLADGGRVSSTYRVNSTSGLLYLETAFGEIPLPAVRPGVDFVVNTRASRWGLTFGEVSSIQNKLGVPGILDLATDYLSEATGAEIQTNTTGTWSIQLGSQLRAQKGLTQLLEGIPYLVYESNATFSVRLGGLNFDASLGDPLGLLAAVDPTDPALFLTLKNAGAVNNFRVGLSRNGRIPFVPLLEPSVAAPPFTRFYGHVYASGGVPIFAGVSFKGDAVIDYDANDDGVWLGGAGNVDALLKGQLFNAGTIEDVAGDFNLGVNGVLHLEYSKYGIDFSQDIGRGSAVYNGTQQGFWVKGIRGNINAPPSFAGTPFADLGGTPEDTFEGLLLRDGTFTVQVGTKYKVLGVTLGYELTVTNEGITARVFGDMKWSVKARIPLTGRVVSATASASFDAKLKVSYVNNALRYEGAFTAKARVGRLWSGRVDAHTATDRIRFDFSAAGLNLGMLDLPLA